MGIRDLGTFGGDRSYAYGINDSGQVIGNSSSRYCDIQCGDVDHAAFLYSDGSFIDLLALAPVVAMGWDQMYALDINNRGQMGVMTGEYDSSSTIFQAFILSPVSAVPEPGAYMMLLVGLGLLGFMARCRKESAV